MALAAALAPETSDKCERPSFNELRGQSAKRRLGSAGGTADRRAVRKGWPKGAEGGGSLSFFFPRNTLGPF